MSVELERAMRKHKQIASKEENILKERKQSDIESHLEQIGAEYGRVAEIYRAPNVIIQDIERQFKQATKLDGIDITFVFLATALQCARQYLITNDKFRLTAKQGDELMEKTVGKVIKPKWQEILLSESVPYDAIRTGKHISESTGLSGTTHRYRTLGHDPVLGWIFGTANIMTNSLTKYNFKSYQVKHNTIIRRYPNGTPALLKRFTEYAADDYSLLAVSVAKQVIHFGSDYFTKQGLPFPLISIINNDVVKEMIKGHIDTYSITRGVAISAMINTLIAVIHCLFYDESSDSDKSLYEVRTKRILRISNTMATGSNILVTAFTQNLNLLDAGGMIETLHRLISDTKYIQEIKRDFLKNELAERVYGSDYDFMEEQNMFGRTKEYTKGMEDAMRANAGFMEKQEAAIKHMQQELHERGEKNVQKVKEDIHVLYDNLENKDKAEAYDLQKKYDIREDLEPFEKEFLIAVLYQLAEEMGDLTSYQQKYILSVQNCLSIVNPQMKAKLEKVQELPSKKDTEIFFQIVLEFFSLQEGSERADWQERFLGYFNISKSRAEAIEQDVSRALYTLGEQGLAEKYDCKKMNGETENTKPEQKQLESSNELIINQDIDIPQDEETVYQNQIIHVRSEINCAGILTFKNCELHYGEPEGYGGIVVKEACILQMENCRIEYHGHGSLRESFIMAEDGNKAIVLDNCEFIDTGMFIQGNRNVVLRNSKMANVSVGFINCGLFNEVTIEDCSFSFPKWSDENKCDEQAIIQCQNINMAHCSVKGDFQIGSVSEAVKARDTDGRKVFLNSKGGKITRCSFSGMRNIYDQDFLLTREPLVLSLTSFDHCVNVLRGVAAVSDCRIEHTSIFAERLGKESSITDSQFIGCYLNMITSRGKVEITGCEFDNWEGEEEVIDDAMISFNSYEKYAAYGKVENCIFNGIQAHRNFIIKASVPKKVEYSSITVSDCQFINCNTDQENGQLIKQKHTYSGAFNSKKERVVINIKNCEGLDEVNKGSGYNKKVKRKLTNAAGEYIGMPEEQKEQTERLPIEEGKAKRFFSWLFKDN